MSVFCVCYKGCTDDEKNQKKLMYNVAVVLTGNRSSDNKKKNGGCDYKSRAKEHYDDDTNACLES